MHMRYLAPKTLDEAIAEIAAGGVPLAGGTVLVPEISRSAIESRTFVDLRRIATLHEVVLQNDHLHLGAMATLAHLARHHQVLTSYTAVARAAAMVGNPQVRRVATVGGNLALGLPVADMPPALLVLDAQVTQLGSQGSTTQPVADFFVNASPRQGLIISVQVPRAEGRRSNFIKFAWRQSSGKTIVNVAVSLRLENGVIAAPRVATGGLSLRATRLPATESMIDGQQWQESLIVAAAHTAAEEVACEVESSPGEAYRRRLVRVGVQRLLMEVGEA